MSLGQKNMDHIIQKKNVMQPSVDTQDTLTDTTTDNKTRYVVYNVRGQEKEFKQGPFSKKEIAFHYWDIWSYDGVYNCRVLEV